MFKTFYGVSSFSHSSRSTQIIYEDELLLKTKDNPGPGTYNENKQSQQQKIPQWTMKNKINYGSCFYQKQNYPSPAQYNAIKMKNNKSFNVNNYKIKKNHLKNNQNYNNNNKINHNIKNNNNNNNDMDNNINDINNNTNQNNNNNNNNNLNTNKNSKNTNKQNKKDKINNLNTNLNKNGFSFGYRQIQNIPNLSPGPIYNINQSINIIKQKQIKGGCKGFGYGQKNCYKNIIQQSNQIDYRNLRNSSDNQNNNENQKSKNYVSGWTFGKSLRQDHQNGINLGPGQYQPKILTNHKRQFVIKGKINQIRQQIFDNGPGKYEIPNKRSTVGTKFNGEIYKKEIENNQPSPCTYAPPRYLNSVNTNNGITLGSKSENKLRQSTPSPFAYDLECKMNNKGGYMGMKLNAKKNLSNEDNFYKYNPKMVGSCRQSPNYSFAKKAVFWEQKQSQDNKIGPGSYNLKQPSLGGMFCSKSKRWKELKKQPNLYHHDNINNYSTIGYLPSYLKTDLKKSKQFDEKDINFQQKKQ